jgi:hypothetical protein
MTHGTATEPARAPLALPAPARRTLALALHRDAAAAVLLAGLFVVLAALTWRTWGDLSHDTGYDWVAADRVASGELPYSDFPYYYGPLGLALLSAAFAVFGSSAAVATAFGLAVAAAAIALTFALARHVAPLAGALAAAALACCAAIATANKGLIEPHTVSASIAVLTALAALVAAARYAARPQRATLVAAGVAAGLACLTRPEFALAVLAALGLWLALRILGAGDPPRDVALREARDCLVPALAIPLVTYGLLALLAGPERLADSLLARDELRAGASEVLRAAAPLTAGSFVELAADLLLYGLGAAALVGLGRALDSSRRARRAVFAAGLLAAAALAAVLLARPEALRSRLDLAYAWIPAGALLATGFLVQRGRHAGTWRPADQAALLVSAFLAVLAAKTYAAFTPEPNPVRAQSAIYALPFAAVFLVWLHGRALAGDRRGVRIVGLAWVSALAIAGLALSVHDARDESARVSGPGGTVAVPAGQAGPLQAVLDAMRTRTGAGEPVLLAPQLSALYVLGERPNPLPQISLLPGALATAHDEAQAIARLRDVRFVAIDRRPRSEYGQGAFGVTYHRQLGAWLRREFELVKTFRGAGDGALTIDIWQRSAS